MTNGNIIITDRDQYDIFMETRGFFEKESSKNVNDINDLIKENICFEDFKMINEVMNGNTTLNIGYATEVYQIISKLFSFISKVIRVTDYKATRDIAYIDIYGEPNTKEIECHFELEVSKSVGIKCLARYTDDKWILEEFIVDSIISDIKAERGTKAEFIYDDDDELSPISEMVLSSRTLKLDLDMNKPNSVLELFARIEELLRGITIDVKELLRTHERSVRIISDSVEIMNATLK